MSQKENVSATDSKKMMAEPPLNLLFNPSLLSAKKDIWDINVTMLLEMLLRVINTTGKKDLRICGIAPLSASIIHRLKVESIFRLEKIAMQRKEVEIPSFNNRYQSLVLLKFPLELNQHIQYL